jgi:hypothetical protein
MATSLQSKLFVSFVHFSTSFSSSAIVAAIFSSM